MKNLFGKKILIYEVIPTKGVDTKKCLRLCKDMHRVGADVIAITDMPVGSVRVAPWAVAKQLLDEGIESLVHFTRRSRNALRIESDLMGIHLLGIRNLLLLSGDDPKLGDYPNATKVEDFTIFQVIELIRKMNEGTDLAGNELKGKTEFFIGAVFNPVSEREIERARKKVEAGVDFLVSQPVFKRELVERMVNALDAPIIMSTAFFKSRRQLEYFAKVPGIEIPEEFFTRTEGRDKEYIAEYTFERVAELVEDVKDMVWGVYVSGIVKDVERVGRLGRIVHS